MKAAESGNPSVIYDLPREEYDRLDGVNFSTLKEMAKSPAHYRHKLLGQDVDTDARKLGRASHIAALEPERFRSECVRWDGGRRAGKEWEAFKAKHRGREILTEDEYQRCMDIQRAVRGDARALSLLSGGRGEVTLLWTHVAQAVGELPGYETRCKARPDFISPLAIVDLKTTRDGSPEGFGREAWRYRYHMQAAYYADGYEAATGTRLPYFIIAVESADPCVVQVYRVPESKLAMGHAEYRGLLDRLAVCRRESRWPGYGDGELELELPRWAMAQNDDEDVTGLDLVLNQ
jgi:exodeoxyribonuclease VIII